jgi:hypothetical protein
VVLKFAFFDFSWNFDESDKLRKEFFDLIAELMQNLLERVEIPFIFGLFSLIACSLKSLSATFLSSFSLTITLIPCDDVQVKDWRPAFSLHEGNELRQNFISLEKVREMVELKQKKGYEETIGRTMGPSGMNYEERKGGFSDKQYSTGSNMGDGSRFGQQHMMQQRSFDPNGTNYNADPGSGQNQNQIIGSRGSQRSKPNFKPQLASNEPVARMDQVRPPPVDTRK